jgi:hypothetical protein
MPNPMEKIQRHSCMGFVNAGGTVLLFVIGRGSKNVKDSVLFGFRVHQEILECSTAAKVYYQHGEGYDIRGLLKQMKLRGKNDV